jgi:non-specific serine/threonine protein kinase
VDANAPPLAEALAQRLDEAFVKGAGQGLLQLGAAEVGSAPPSALAWWRDFAVRYVTALCSTPEGGEIAVARPDELTIQILIADLPPMVGAEYLTPEAMATLWDELDAALRDELAVLTDSRH